MIDVSRKRVLSAASILLLVILGATCLSSSPAQQYSLKEALDRGFVRARICSSDWLMFYGYSLDLEVENTWNATITVCTTLGRICLPGDEEVQSMVIAKVICVTLLVGETKEVPLIAYCTESGDAAPGEGDCYQLGGIAEELIAVLTVINNRGITEIEEDADPFELLSDVEYGEENWAAQEAIWWVLEGREEVGELGNLTALEEMLNISGLGEMLDIEMLNMTAVPGGLAEEIYEESLTITPTPPPTTPPATTTPPPTAPSRCLIATATYGSELTREVQFLRQFRDDVIMRTFAGREFMKVFNAWYYSFSPTVAGFISDHSAASTATKFALYPLVGILRITSSATGPLFATSAELGAVISGLIASSLIGIVYFSPMISAILFAFERIKGWSIRKHRLKYLLVPWAASLALLCLGEISGSSPLTAFSAALVVLTTLASSSFTVASVLVSFMTGKKGN